MSRDPHGYISFKSLAALSGALVMGGLFTVSLFGDNIRSLFGASADSLAGNEYRYPMAGVALEGHKSLADFSAASADSPYGGEVASGDKHEDHGVNGFFSTEQDRFSTFAIDVDTASYTFSRRAIREGRLPHAAGVRVEEFVNAFAYGYPAPRQAPFSVSVDGMPSPFDPDRVFLRVGLQGRRVEAKDRKPARLVFLVDVSGSMSSPDKLPMAQEALKLLARNLRPKDTVALCTYAGSTRLVLPPTGAEDLETIEEAIDSLTSGGGTAMNSGLETAYALARKGLSPQVTTRVIVLSDGDANLGPSRTGDMLQTIAQGAREGVTLTTVGFGSGNYNDAAMERLADEGNGQSVYIDGPKEARKVFQAQLEGTLEVIAKDVKIQVEFDSSVVKRYRLVGYENRDIADRDFRNDARDAGEVGAGHSVTAVYELELTDRAADLGTVRVRAKDPEAGVEDPATEYAFAIGATAVGPAAEASDDLRFALGVASLAERLRGSAFALEWSAETIVELTCDAAGQSDERVEHCELARQAAHLLESRS
ncbi:MAG: von Willebrand factor type A domain-containing protein [Deltaproteobacteria bacterium]|nr:von Willebrand factor type A domain-containing protein [Deltaproteobacteria bacterium]